MIYIENIRTAQTISVPVNGLAEGGSDTPARLTIRSTVEKREVYAEDVTLAADAYYYGLSVTLPEGTRDGEYEYELSQMGQTLSRGLVQVGEYDRVPKGSDGPGIVFRQSK